MENIQYIINEFCTSVKKEFPNINFTYQYDKENDTWIIWHNYKNFDDIKFRKEVGKNIIKYFFDNNLTNTSFAYNSDIDKK